MKLYTLFLVSAWSNWGIFSIKICNYSNEAIYSFLGVSMVTLLIYSYPETLLEFFLGLGVYRESILDCTITDWFAHFGRINIVFW